MKTYLSISLLFLLVVSGCKRQNAPDYDNRQCVALLESCEAIAVQKDDEALQILQKLKASTTDADDFVEEASLAIQRRKDSKTIQELLRNCDIERLRQFLLQRRRSGDADTDLLQDSSLPDALEALLQFCAKMPWESPDVLEDSLAQLEVQTEILREFPAFKKFRQAQVDRLIQLRIERNLAQAKAFLSLATKYYFMGNAIAFTKAEEEFRKQQPDHSYFAWKSSLAQGNLPKIPEDAETLPFFFLALVQEWHRLPAKELEEIAIPQNDTILSAWLHSRKSKTYLPFLLKAKQENVVLGGAVLQETLNAVLPTSPDSKSEKEGSSSPSPFELFSILNRVQLDAK